MDPLRGRCEDIFITGAREVGQSAVSWSRFQQPISYADGKPHGFSRNWGDAPQAVQHAVVEEIVRQSEERKLNRREQAFALAVARVESGFNPDAAALTSSASGVGQFITSTGAYYGLNDQNRFSIVDSVRAMLAHLGDTLTLARRRAPTDEFARAYAIYHDGPTKTGAGLSIARKELLPWLPRMERWLLECQS